MYFTVFLSSVRQKPLQVATLLSLPVAPNTAVYSVFEPAVKKHYSPDSEAMGFLLQITMSCPRARFRERLLVLGAGAGAAGCARGGDRLLVPVLVLGAGCQCCCCELAVHVVEAGCWC